MAPVPDGQTSFHQAGDFVDREIGEKEKKAQQLSGNHN